MSSLVSFFRHDGTYLNQFIANPTITQKLNGLTEASLALPHTDPKITEDFLLPNNYVVVDDEFLAEQWVGVITTPTASNNLQTTIGLSDPKVQLQNLPIISVSGLGIGAISLQGIAFVIDAAKGTKYEHRFTFSADENGFTFGTLPLEADSAVHIGKDIFTFIEELAADKHFDWWLEPVVTSAGTLVIKLRVADIRKSEGLPIYIPKHGTVQGVGLAYPDKFFTALVITDIIETENHSVPVFKDYIEFPGLVEKFGVIAKTVTQGELKHKEKPLGKLFKDLRPRRNVTLEIDTQYTSLIKSIKLGSIHSVALGDIGYTGNLRGTMLTMRCTALTYTAGENAIAAVFEEYFDADETLELGT